MNQGSAVNGAAGSSTASSTVAVVVLAGGSGLRVGHDRNKAYLPLGTRTAVGMSLQTMATATMPGLRRLVLVVRTDDRELAERTLDEELPRPSVPVELVVGGSTRHGSERQALRCLERDIHAGAVDLVLIHDAARPLVSPAMIDRVVNEARKGHGAIAALPVVDTLKQVDEHGTIVKTVERAQLWRAQTPQGFPHDMIVRAHREARAAGVSATDDAALCERLGLPVVVVRGSERALKVTEDADFARVDALFSLPE